MTLMTAREGFAWGAAFTNYAEVGHFWGDAVGGLGEVFFSVSQKDWVVVSNIFLFSPLPGEMIQFD